MRKPWWETRRLGEMLKPSYRDAKLKVHHAARPGEATACFKAAEDGPLTSAEPGKVTCAMCLRALARRAAWRASAPSSAG